MLKKIQVIGGGFSGLTLTYYLTKMGFSVDVWEKEKRWGGWLRSEKHPLGLIESAANGILETSLSLELFSDLNLSFVGAKKESQRRYVYRKQSLRRWPLNLFESLRFFFGLIFFCLFRFSLCRPRQKETVFQWGKRIFGKGATSWLIAPFLQGIYASDIKKLSAYLVFRKFFQKNNRTSKRFSKRKSIRLIAPLGGMEDLIQALIKNLKEKGVHFYEGKKVDPETLLESFSFDMTSDMTSKAPVTSSPPISLSEEESKGLIVLALSFKQMKPWIVKGASLEMQDALGRLSSLSLVSVTLFYNSPSPFKGFGVLFPEKNVKALGVLNNGDVFENRVKNSGHSETWIFGNETKTEKENHEILNHKDPYWLEVIQKEREIVFGRSCQPLYFKISRSKDVFPSYDVELERFLSLLHASFPSTNLHFVPEAELISRSYHKTGQDQRVQEKDFYLTGNYLGGLGLSQILEYNKKLSHFIFQSY